MAKTAQSNKITERPASRGKAKLRLAALSKEILQQSKTIAWNLTLLSAGSVFCALAIKGILAPNRPHHFSQTALQGINVSRRTP